jgi:hypothetical protein
LVAKLPAQTCRFKLRISVNLCDNSGDAFLDTTGSCPLPNRRDGPTTPDALDHVTLAGGS